jgi:probable F420-dependent oxidoreductase
MKLNAAVHGVSFAELPRLAATLEDAGCHGLLFAEIAHDPFLPVAVAAQGTSRLVLGTSIALAFTRSPTSLAYLAHDLVSASAGRFVLGLGPQVKPHIERRFAAEWGNPVRRMREVVQAIRAVWECWENDSDPRFEGDYYRLSLMPPAFRPEPIPHPMPPIYLAAVGPDMARLAGETADGIFIHAFSTPTYVRSVILPAVEEGLRRSGRARTDFQVCYSAFVAHGATNADVHAARERMRTQLAFYASTPDYRRVLEVEGVGDLQPKLRGMTRQGAWSEMGKEISDAILDQFCISGTAHELCGQLVERWDGMADQISLPTDLWASHASDPAWRRATRELMDRQQPKDMPKVTAES